MHLYDHSRTKVHQPLYIIRTEMGKTVNKHTLRGNMREHPLYTPKQAAKPQNSAAEVEIDDGIQYHRAASAHAALVFRLSR